MNTQDHRDEKPLDLSVIVAGAKMLRDALVEAGGDRFAMDWIETELREICGNNYHEFTTPVASLAGIVYEALTANLKNSVYVASVMKSGEFLNTSGGAVYSYFMRWYYGPSGLVSMAEAARLVFGDSERNSLNKIAYRMTTGEIRKVARDPRSINHRPDYRRKTEKTSREWLLVKEDVEALKAKRDLKRENQPKEGGKVKR